MNRSPASTFKDSIYHKLLLTKIMDFNISNVKTVLGRMGIYIFELSQVWYFSQRTSCRWQYKQHASTNKSEGKSQNRCTYVTFVYQIEWSCAEHGE